jgi:hypothetical protein
MMIPYRPGEGWLGELSKQAHNQLAGTWDRSLIAYDH